ncbi:hypothetical protein ACE1CI_03945 [Aerosakkonemataceae cyanobacterium BLCC-F50]|uniref:Phage tail assembly protein n=1 Tax=Floridaenema flaviceps BLCC-F50 TaxID=3153642 RepID=A0ABV4XK55_9CYAN
MDKPKYLADEKGNINIVLPVSGANVSLRPPKGKDLAAIEKASKTEDITNVEIMASTIALLASPKMSKDEALELDGEDLIELGQALSFFRVLGRNSQ